MLLISGSKKMKIYIDHEFITAFALMIGAGVYSDQGCSWSRKLKERQ